MDEETVRFIDLFSGIGGMRRGLEQANIAVAEQGWVGSQRLGSKSQGKRWNGQPEKGFRCVWSCDNDKYANAVYAYQWGTENHHAGDARQVDPESLPDFDLLCAGFPCQSFSLAGKRQGFNDVRGTLFHEIVRLAEAKKPKVLLLENVKGLLSNDGGKTFGTVLEELGNIDYWVEWQNLNGKHWVPQNRERVFIVGHLRGEPGGEVFPVTQIDSIFNGKNEIEPEGREASTLDATYGKTKSLSNLVQVGNIFSGEASDGRVYDPKGISPAIRPSSFGWAKPKILAVETAHTKANMKQGRFSEVSHSPDGGNSKAVIMYYLAHAPNSPEKRWGKHKIETSVSPTLSTDLAVEQPVYPEVANILCDGWLMDTKYHSKPMNQYRIRRLTPTECERLQGFPDGWTAKGLDENGKEVAVSDTQRYKLCGNSVVVPLIEFLGKRILDRCF